MGCKCFKCGHELCIDDNYMGSDLDLVKDDSEDADFMVTVMHCRHCGVSYEVYDCSAEEQKDYPFYKEECNAK